MKLRKFSILFLVLFLSIKLTIEQNITSLTPITQYTINDCTPLTQYFEQASLQCKNCPTNSKSYDRLNCKCDQNYYFKMNNGGGSISCAECPIGLTQSLDGFSCVECKNECTQCNDGFRTDLDIYGNQLTASTCIICNKENSILVGNSCKSCKSYIFTESNTNEIETLKCNSSFTQIGGFLFLTSTVIGEPNSFGAYFGGESVDSWFFKEYSRSSYRTCRIQSKRNITSCQILANMCVLNMYTSVQSSSISQIEVDVCRSYDDLYSKENSTDGSLPWLRFTETYGDYKSRYLKNGINSEYLQLKFSSNCNTNKLDFVSADYDIRGNLVKFGKFDLTKLQLCNLNTAYGKISNLSPFSTTNIVQKCSIKLKNLFDLADKNSVNFYDIYLQFGNGSSILPVPVKTLNYKNGNEEVNRGSNENQHLHQRRFFLYETISSKTTSNSESVYIRYAKSIKIVFELIKEKSNGEIYPPVIVVEYDYEKRDEQMLDKTVEINFTIEYKSNVDNFLLGIYITIGTLSVISFIYSCIRIWNWNRRSGRIAVDFITLFKFIMFLNEYIANSIFLVIIGGSIYWLMIYRGQTFALVFLPETNQEKLIGLFVIVSFSLKLLDILHLTFLQSSYDVFFIDWERPKLEYKTGNTMNILPPIRNENKNNDQNKTNKKSGLNDIISEQLSQQNKISCWRTLFVANEWNELQTYRKTNTTLQLIFVLFFLKVINLESLAYRDCSTKLFRDQNEYQAPFSLVLRIAIAASMYLAIGLLQLFIYSVIYSRCIEDKIGQFIDFCSVSNISIFIMTHTQYGYYIHGRSPHGYSDTSMQQMTQALIREEIDLAAKRGLDQGSNHQTFSISVPNKLSRQYSKVMIPLAQKQSVNRTIRRDEITSSSEFEKKMLAYTQLNRFLISFIDNTLRDLNYSIVNRNFIENVMDVEFKEPHPIGYFYQDEMSCFTETIFFGKEKSLFIFDLLLFLFVDYFANDFVLAAVVVYIVSKLIKVIRSDLGKRNLSRKTLVDKRFLI